MSFRWMTGVVGVSPLLVAAYQLVTGSLALHVGKAVPSIPMNPRGTRLFAVGLVCFGIVLKILALQPAQIPSGIWRGWMGIEPTQDASAAPRRRF